MTDKIEIKKELFYGLIFAVVLFLAFAIKSYSSSNSYERMADIQRDNKERVSNQLYIERNQSREDIFSLIERYDNASKQIWLYNNSKGILRVNSTSIAFISSVGAVPAQCDVRYLGNGTIFLQCLDPQTMVDGNIITQGYIFEAMIQFLDYWADEYDLDMYLIEKKYAKDTSIEIEVVAVNVTENVTEVVENMTKDVVDNVTEDAEGITE